jgi:hypothetical protein
MRVLCLLIVLVAILVLVSASKPFGVAVPNIPKEGSYSFDKRGLKFWQAVDELVKAKKVYDGIRSQSDIESNQRLNIRRIPKVNSLVNSFEKLASKFLKRPSAFTKGKKLFPRASSESDIDNRQILVFSDLDNYSFDKKGLNFWQAVDELVKAKKVYDKISSKSDIDNYSFDKKGLNFWQAVDELVKAKKVYDKINSKSDIDNSQNLVFSDLDNYSFDKKGLNFWQAVDELVKAKKVYDRISTKSDRNWHFRG